MKKGLLYFLIAALAISYGLYAVQHLGSPVGSPSIAGISTGAIATGALADEGRTAIVQTTEVDLNSFLNLYQQNTFSKVLLKDGITLEGYETTATGSVSNFLINALGIKVDTKYNLVTTTKPADTSLNELGFTLTGSDTTPVTVIYNRADFFEKVFLEQIVPLLFFVLLIVLFMRMMGSKMGGGMPFNFKAGILRTNADVKTKFTDVAGMDEVKQELIEIVDYLSNPKKYLDVGARIPKGVLLRGPPGSGKTLLARAVAGEAGVPFYSASGSEFMEMLVGMGAAKVRELFKKAKASAPSIIFIDEIDTIGRKRGSGYTGGHQEQEQTLNQILTEMDGFEKDNNVIVIAATNRPDTLDSALLRPGRFDRKVFVGRPTLEERTMILQYYLKNKKINIDFDVESLAKRMSGFVGADLENVVNEAALKVAKDNRKMLTMEDFEYAFEKVIMGPEKKIKTLKEKERNIVAYHELGHAVTARNLENCDPVEKISIVSRGMALGVTWMIPDEERYLYSKAKFMDEIVSLLGGRAAEELFFGKDEITTGASNDFEKVHRIVYDMLLKYGMDEELGTIMYHDESKGEYHSFRPYSEKLAEQIDEKVKTIVKDRYQQSLKILAANKALIEKMKTYLLYVEYINKEEFSNIMTNPEVIDDMIASMEAKMEAKKAQQEQQSKQNPLHQVRFQNQKELGRKKVFSCCSITMLVDPFDLIQTYYDSSSLSYRVLIQHSTMVAATSLAIARRWNEHHPDQQVDTQFIYEAAMLHDIGIYAVHAPAMGCIGEKTYIEHGYIGYLLLLDHNLPSHARVALTHTGVGIQKQEIIDNGLPLPVDLDYTPMSIEEKIISYADLYYSKSRYNQLLVAKTPAQARASVAKFGEAQGVIFDEWFALFE